MKILFIYKREVKLDDTSVEILRHPKKIVDRLNKAETEAVLDKCETYKKIEKVEDFKKFWEDIKTLCLHHLDRIVKFEMKKKGNVNIHNVIAEEFNEDVEALIRGKANKDLDDLEAQAQKFLSLTDLNLDVEFWDQIVSRIQVQKAVMSLERLHEKYFEGKGLQQDKPDPKGTGLPAKPTQSIMQDNQKQDPLSPRPYEGDLSSENVKIYSEEEYRLRLEAIRKKSFQKQLNTYVKMAEKEIELRKAKDSLADFDGEESSKEEESDRVGDEVSEFRSLLQKSDHHAEEDELVFDDFEDTKKVGLAHRAVRLDRQVQAAQATLLQPSEDGLRVEQGQPGTLRPGDPAAEAGAGLQVQHLLPQPDQQNPHPFLRALALRQPRLLHNHLQGGAAIRRPGLQNRPQRVGLVGPPGLQVHLRPRHLAPALQLQARSIQKIISRN